MQRLKLNKRQKFTVDFQAKIAEKASKMSQLLYLECQEDDNNRYRAEIWQLTNDINAIRLEAGKNQPSKY